MSATSEVTTRDIFASILVDHDEREHFRPFEPKAHFRLICWTISLLFGIHLF